MAKVIITTEDVGNTIEIGCREIGCSSDTPMIRGIAKENTPAQNYANIAIMTINANACMRGEEVQDVHELKQ